MLKKEIKFITDLNLNKLQVVGDRFTIEDVKNSKIHASLVKFIDASIDQAIFSDRKEIESKSLFNYKTDRINNYFLLICEEIKRTQHFELDYIKQLVHDGILFNVNYLSNPGKALTQIIFEESDEKSVEEIILGISHTYYYKYLQKILLSYLEKKQILTMNKEEFQGLIIRIDEISKETHLIETLSTTVNSMSNFFDQNSRTAERLPLEAIQTYLESKKLNEFLDQLNQNFVVDSTTLFFAEDIIKVLKSVTPETEIVFEQTLGVDDPFEKDQSTIAVSNSTNELPPQEIIIEDQPLTVLEEFEVVEMKEDTKEILDENSEFTDSSHHNDDVNELRENSAVEESELATSVEFEDFQDDVHNDEDESEKPSAENNLSENREDDEKKKPDVNQILLDLIALDPMYESLLPKIKPFENFEEQISIIGPNQHESDELDYKLDKSTIHDEIDIHSSQTTDPFINELDNLKNLDTKYEADENPNSEINTHDIMERENLDFSDTIDDIVNDEDGEHEFLNTKDDTENLDENESKPRGMIINEDELRLSDEDGDEITEVFTDLTYLDKNELNDAENNNSLEKVNDESLKHNIRMDQDLHTFDSEKISEKYENMMQILATKDLTRIIEFLFDYDMEEYHNIINKLSLSQSENEAHELIVNYCIKNHIDIESNEVNTFKLIISEYFSKVY